MTACFDRPVPVDLADQPLGRIAVERPGATAVFQRLRLDFYCGGRVSLRAAAQDRHLDLPQLLEALTSLDPGSEAPQANAPATLIEHILTRYHEAHRAQLPELVRMARRVEAEHPMHPQVPAGLADQLEGLQDDLFYHMHKEERLLFPLLKAGRAAFSAHPIVVMRAEHGSHGEGVERVMALAQDAAPPQEAGPTWCALYAGIVQLRDDLLQHIHLENNVLFPQFEPTLDACGSMMRNGKGPLRH